MEINEKKTTLFVEGSNYLIQNQFEALEGNYQCRGYLIEQFPESEDGELIVKLFVSPTGTRKRVIHEFNLGHFPIEIKKWSFLGKICTMEGTEHGRIIVAQEEGEAEPRPGSFYN